MRIRSDIIRDLLIVEREENALLHENLDRCVNVLRKIIYCSKPGSWMCPVCDGLKYHEPECELIKCFNDYNTEKQPSRPVAISQQDTKVFGVKSHG